VTAEPAWVISVMNPWAWRIVAGLQAVEERPWKPSWRGVRWIHASEDTDLSAPAGLWPPAGQVVISAIIGRVTLAAVEGRLGAWRWILTDPHQLTKPETGVHGHPGLWLIDLAPRLSTGSSRGEDAALTHQTPGRVMPSSPRDVPPGPVRAAPSSRWGAVPSDNRRSRSPGPATRHFPDAGQDIQARRRCSCACDGVRVSSQKSHRHFSSSA
jgi:hypothetical protein